MKQNIMKKWVQALRSGDYKQGFGLLTQRKPHQKTEYCCLGVLCDLAIKDEVKLNINIRKEPNGKIIKEIDGHVGVLSQKVSTWSGIKNPAGEFNNCDFLIDYNDGGRSFNEIANIIEKKYKQL